MAGTCVIIPSRGLPAGFKPSQDSFRGVSVVTGHWDSATSLAAGRKGPRDFISGPRPQRGALGPCEPQQPQAQLPSHVLCKRKQGVMLLPVSGLPAPLVLPLSLDPAPYQGDKVMILPLNQRDEGRTCRCLSFPTWLSTWMRQRGDASVQNIESQRTTAKPHSP